MFYLQGRKGFTNKTVQSSGFVRYRGKLPVAFSWPITPRPVSQAFMWESWKFTGSIQNTGNEVKTPYPLSNGEQT